MTYRLIQIKAKGVFVGVSSTLSGIIYSLEVAREVVGRLDFGCILGWRVSKVLDRGLPIVVRSDGVHQSHSSGLVEWYTGYTLVGDLSGHGGSGARTGSRERGHELRDAGTSSTARSSAGRARA